MVPHFKKVNKTTCLDLFFCTKKAIYALKKNKMGSFVVDVFLKKQ